MQKLKINYVHLIVEIGRVEQQGTHFEYKAPYILFILEWSTEIMPQYVRHGSPGAGLTRMSSLVFQIWKVS